MNFRTVTSIYRLLVMPGEKGKMITVFPQTTLLITVFFISTKKNVDRCLVLFTPLRPHLRTAVRLHLERARHMKVAPEDSHIILISVAWKQGKMVILHLKLSRLLVGYNHCFSPSIQYTAIHCTLYSHSFVASKHDVILYW
jgi:hypothetical protein